MPTYDIRFNPDWPNATELIDIGIEYESLEEAVKLLQSRVLPKYPFAIVMDNNTRYQVPSEMIGQTRRDASGATLILGFIIENLTAKEKKIREFESLLDEIRETRRKLRRLAKSRVKLSYEIEAME